MKITSIKQQVKQAGRYSIFVDGEYSFSLSESALVESGLASGQELSPDEVKKFKQLSSDDKLYQRALRYAAIRLRSRWEMEFYLQRKDAPPHLIEEITGKLEKVGLLDDEALARSMINDRQLLKPTSRRKLQMELRKKRVTDHIIQSVMAESEVDDRTAIKAVIERKRRQTKYQDDQKLMQYLARQGFGYDDIKTALNKNT